MATLDVTQTLMFAEPSDNARARGIVCWYATHTGNEIDMTDMNNTIGAIADFIMHQAVRLICIGHSGNEIDMTDMKNTIDTIN